MTEIESGSVMAMRDARLDDVLKTVNAARGRSRLAVWFALIGVAIVVLAAQGAPAWLVIDGLSSVHTSGLLVGGAVVFAVLLLFAGVRLDTTRLKAVVAHDLDGHAEAAYRHLVDAFDNMVSSAAVWHVSASASTSRAGGWKRHGGTSHLVHRSRTRHGYGLPPATASNITPPFIAVGRQILYFLPDAVFVIDGRRIGAVPYPDLIVEVSTTRFVEEEAVPADAMVVDYTWLHPNKAGGPDRRFANNREIPVVLYDELFLSSRTGLKVMLQVSRPGAVAALVGALGALGKVYAPAQAQDREPLKTNPACGDNSSRV